MTTHTIPWRVGHPAGRWDLKSILPITAGVVFFAMECFRYLYLFRFADDRKLTEWLPDDAFYYLIPGRNFALLHKWTFDGVAPATGFHLLWGYLIALVYWLFPNISLHQIFTLLYFLSAFLLAASLSISCIVACRIFGLYSFIGPVAIFFTSLAAQLTNFLLESCLAAFFSCVAVYIGFAREKPLTRYAVAAAFGVGALGMLSRSDFGLLPFVMLIVSLAIYRSIQSQTVRTAGYVLGGSIVGLLLVLGHSYLVSGHFVQSSAIVKQRWASLDRDHSLRTGDLNYLPSGYSVSRATLPLISEHDRRNTYAFPVVAYGVGLTFLLLALVGTGLSVPGRPAIAIVCAMCGVVVGYIVFYGHNGAVAPWYFASYLAPYSVLAASIFANPGKAWRAVVTALLILLIGKTSPIRKAAVPEWPQQVGYFQAGLYLRQHPELKPVGAWNAGINSYFAGGGVINLDGLVNDDAAQHVLSNSLKDYLAKRQITRVVDDSIMWDSDLTRSHGGYAGDVLTRCINSRTTLWQTPNPALVGDNIVLSVLDPQCLGSPRAKLVAP